MKPFPPWTRSDALRHGRDLLLTRLIQGLSTALRKRQVQVNCGFIARKRNDPPHHIIRIHQADGLKAWHIGVNLGCITFPVRLRDSSALLPTTRHPYERLDTRIYPKCGSPAP
jgi:hypothetical protein